MIEITRLNKAPIFINPDLIELMERTPDTVITLSTGRKIVAIDPCEELIAKIIKYRQEIYTRLPDAVDKPMD